MKKSYHSSAEPTAAAAITCFSVLDGTRADARSAISSPFMSGAAGSPGILPVAAPAARSAERAARRYAGSRILKYLFLAPVWFS